MDYEEVLELIGGCGRFQLTAFVLLSVSTFKAAFDIQTLQLVAFTPTFVCANSESNDTCVALLGNGSEISCAQWNYSDSVLRKTMVTEMDLVCDKADFAMLIPTVTLAGSAIGMLLGGAGDIVGRRTMLLIQAVWDAVFSVCIVFVPGLYPQLVLRFLREFKNGMHLTGAVYIKENVSVKYRMNLGCNYFLMWCIGYATCAGIGKWLQEWRYIQGFSACITVVYISYFFLIPESPRWLLLKGRSEEASAIFSKIARWNGRRIPTNILEHIKVRKEPVGRVLDLFRSKQMCLKTVCCWMLLWAFGCSYMGISLHSSFASDDIFINMAIMGLIEIPSCPFGWYVSDKVGRRRATLIMNLLTSACLISVPFLDHMPWVRICVAVLGKFFICASFCVADVWVAECFPTCVRSLGQFGSAVCATIAATVAPTILAIKKPVVWMPDAIFAAQTLLSLLVLLVLPETMGAPLLQTVEEADLFVRGKEHTFKQRLRKRRTADGETLHTPVDVEEHELGVAKGLKVNFVENDL